MSKTFFILFLSLLVSCGGAHLVIFYFRDAYKNKEKFVFAKTNKHGELTAISPMRPIKSIPEMNEKSILE